MYGCKYVWVIYIFDKYGWWKCFYFWFICILEEVNEGVKGIFYVNYMWFSSLEKIIEVGMVSEYV